MFQENAVSYKFSNKLFQNSIMWLQSRTIVVKPDEYEVAQSKLENSNASTNTTFENEFVLIYHNCSTFQKSLRNGSLH
jgi:hypothetical protein